MNWTQIVSHSNNVFEFSTIEPLRRLPNESDMEINDAKDQNDSGRLDFVLCRPWTFLNSFLEMLLTMMAQRDVQDEYLRLRGQMLYVHEWKAIIYLATPV